MVDFLIGDRAYDEDIAYTCALSRQLYISANID